MNRAELVALCPDPDSATVRAGLAAAALGDRVLIVCRDVPVTLRRARDLLDGPGFLVGRADVRRITVGPGAERIDFEPVGPGQPRGGSVLLTRESSWTFRTRGARVDVVLWE